jgi:alpha-ketoglutarate-dependent 2,4-dichlorophenoxyacetate dioxygenase
MTIAIRQIHPVFVGEVSGIDITCPISREEVAAIDAGMDRYAVLVFRDQKLSDEQQMAFSRQLGPLENARSGNITKPEDRRLTVGMNDVSNLGKDGRLLERDSRQRVFNLGNMLWHSDSSYRVIPAKYSLLSARVVNPKGGNTEYADMRAAYDALDADTKAEIEDLVCEHSLLYSRGLLGPLDYSEEERAMFRPVRQRLVRTHPVTGLKSLYLSAHAGAPSLACRWRKRASCYGISPSTPPSRVSSTCTRGVRGTSSCGTTGGRCTACAAMTTASRAI